jgi:hypothetical protein
VRFSFSALATLPLLVAGACGLESGGPAGNPDGGMESGLEDRGSGMNESGMPCACVPNPGPMWKFIAYIRDGADMCPGDYAMDRFAVEENQTGPAVCQCMCGAPTSNATCNITSTSISTYLNANCSGNPDSTFSAGNACFDAMPDYNPNGVVSAKGTAQIMVSGGSCGAPMAMTNVPSDLHKGKACTLTGALGGGCPTMTDACVPKTAAPFGLCVLAEMKDATCPAGYNTKHKVGSGKTDTRTCSMCNCNPDPLCPVTAKFNDKNDCTGNDQGSTFTLDNVCHSVTNGGLNGHAIKIDLGSVTQRCSSSGGMPTGAVSLDAEYTICCP